jgi:hypothetical protein
LLDLLLLEGRLLLGLLLLQKLCLIGEAAQKFRNVLSSIKLMLTINNSPLTACFEST